MARIDDPALAQVANGSQDYYKIDQPYIDQSIEVPMYDHDDGVEICIPTSDLEIDTFYDPDLFDELALDETSVDVSGHTTPVRGNVRSISSRPCSPGLAPRMARVGQCALGSVGDGIGSDQVVSCREQYR